MTTPPTTEELLELVGRLGRELFAPRAHRWDEEASFPFENYDDLREHGLMSLCVPTRVGGMGADFFTYSRVSAELGRWCGTTALTFNMHSCTCLWPSHVAEQLELDGEQRRQLLSMQERVAGLIQDEDALFAQPFSEPDQAAAAGRAPFGTTARRVDGGWLLNGRKHFASLAGAATHYAVLCTEEAEGAELDRRDTLMLGVPANADGFTITGDWDPLGMRGTVSRTLELNDVFVPDDLQILPRGVYFQMAVHWPHMFMTLGPTFLGIAQAAFDFTVSYLRGEQPGGPEATRDRPVKQIAVGEMRILLDQATSAPPQCSQRSWRRSFARCPYAPVHRPVHGDRARQPHLRTGDPDLRRSLDHAIVPPGTSLSRQPLRVAHVALHGRGVPGAGRTREPVRARGALMVLPVVWTERKLDPSYTSPLSGMAELAHGEGGDDPFAGIETAAVALAGGRIAYDAAVFERAPGLLAVIRFGIGFDNVNLVDATSHGVMACNTPDAPTRSTAEHTIALLLAVAKQLKPIEAALARRDGDYHARHDALELDGARLGLIGLGRIGGLVAQLARGLGMTVVAHDPVVSDERFSSLGVQRASRLDDAVAGADVVSVHVPLSDETRNLVDADLIARMKRGAILLNCARGGIVDETALIEAIDSGQLGGAGLDTTDPEPPPPASPLLDRAQIIVTPHVASATVAGKARLYGHAVDRAVQVLRGERPDGLLNPGVWETRRAR